MQIFHILNHFFYPIFPSMEGKSKDDDIYYLNYLPKEKVKEIALEIAQAGIHGIDPNKDGYKLAHVTGKKFSGSQFLAWYYVSWSMAMPDAVDMLGLPYGKEYELAQKMGESDVL